MVERAVAAPAVSSVDSLFDANYERLVQHLSVVAGSREVAADAVQEAFVAAHVKWDRISTYEDPAGWVRRVALNRIRNHHRWRGRSRVAVARLGGGAATMGSVVERVDLAEALATLSLRQRAAVVLHHLEGLSIEEVATELKVTAGTVKTHLHRGRAALRELLEDDDGA